MRPRISCDVQKQKAGLYSQYVMKGAESALQGCVRTLPVPGRRIPKDPRQPQPQAQGRKGRQRGDSRVLSRNRQKTDKDFSKIWHYRECSAPGHSENLQWCLGVRGGSMPHVAAGQQEQCSCYGTAVPGNPEPQKCAIKVVCIYLQSITLPDG